MQNGPSTEAILNIPIQYLVRVWREKKGWKRSLGSYQSNITFVQLKCLVVPKTYVVQY